MSQSLVIDLYSLLCFVVRSLYETGERKWTELQYRSFTEYRQLKAWKTAYRRAIWYRDSVR